jgi:hypothetical protein
MLITILMEKQALIRSSPLGPFSSACRMNLHLTLTCGIHHLTFHGTSKYQKGRVFSIALFVLCQLEFRAVNRCTGRQPGENMIGKDFSFQDSLRSVILYSQLISRAGLVQPAVAESICFCGGGRLPISMAIPAQPTRKSLMIRSLGHARAHDREHCGERKFVVCPVACRPNQF